MARLAVSRRATPTCRITSAQGLNERRPAWQLGSVGSNVVSIAGTLPIGSAVSGSFVALPRHRSGWRRLIGVKLRSGATRTLFDIHRSLGSTLCLLLMLATLTAITLVSQLRARPRRPVLQSRAVSHGAVARSGPAASLSLQKIHDRVSRTYPGSAISEIHVPSKATAGYLVYVRKDGDIHRLGDTLVWIHPGAATYMSRCMDEAWATLAF